ncbi:MAG: Methyltransferase type 11 [candidate division WWE3 bacterium GW2011_GWF2_41_45]|uniref:Methyltransferase type 11 n=1 Tax=candidate division WWE3 bacterium GW2011_GWC2_41_23 TaxID=1619123 RepID=A0A0G0Y1V0_UNCKA|nr:MAG: Methyltransferase type 11 [candidate division WWE3 bacterium GW2011_GWC2_41_23]KKS10799.1 MAG: Methyltransferase type 11 [candidate division WWE3 bacterium GW2011_GWF2_41_45]KKS12475.1 MAG: Methyltransferase type 11 [candidate division WWE3 bacterium GW2011_GWF1_41_53]KKS20146.1 MAG: Methyltransferase type 11 [candidate division WWE3 bacterium GW2011_GWE1_41_72]KKS28488.1 MAG: Methyltransferase type 11 [candidate division WWE3 bacterium GW2011_GWC1_42_102]KKS29805.1 MAG: Methyltransfer
MTQPVSSSYSSGKYYDEVYNRNVSLKVSSKWFLNYYISVKGVCSDFEKDKTRSIIEIGSGHGGFIKLLNDKGFNNVVASDINSSIYRGCGLQNRYYKLDILKPLPLEEKFDVVIAFDVFEHIDNMGKAAVNIYELLNSGGRVLFSVPFPSTKHLYDRFHTNMQLPHYYTNIFNSLGFKLDGVCTMSFTPVLWRFGCALPLKLNIESRVFITEVFFNFRKL